MTIIIRLYISDFKFCPWKSEEKEKIWQRSQNLDLIPTHVRPSISALSFIVNQNPISVGTL